MDMEVQIISRETIRPSSETPPHLRIHKLCLLDQLAPPLYIPIVFFYSPTSLNSGEISNRLKKSLSETLTHFYPFAGQVRDGFSIDCNDHGATYIEANVAGDMSMVVKQPEIDMLQRLLPCNPHEKLPESRTQAILAVQVNYFACGGMAIAVCIKHVIADASATATFVKTWATVASGSAKEIDGVIFDGSSLFPPRDISCLRKTIEKNQDVLVPEIVTKRFLFEGPKIAALRDKIRNGFHADRPTRVEAVSALIWSALITAAKEKDEVTIPMHVATTAVNLRKRMNPPLPPHCIGNAYQVTMASWQMEKTINHYSLVGKLHESIKKMNNEYVRKIHGDGGFLNIMRSAAEDLGKRSKGTGVFNFSSWCRFPFYDADFGWGKPVWLGSALKLNKLAIFLDASDGQGIEAWIGLSKEEMAKLEQNPSILAYASFSSSST